VVTGASSTVNDRMNIPGEQKAASPGGWTHAALAWLLSLAAHLTGAILAALLIRGSLPWHGTDFADSMEAALLTQRAVPRTQYFRDDEIDDRHDFLQASVSGAVNSAQAWKERGVGGMPGAASSQPPLVAGISLPDSPGPLAGGDGLIVTPRPGSAPGRPRISSGISDAAILAEDAAIPREKIPTGPTAELSLFGSAAATGRSFVFVIDRSASMGSDGLGAIQAAAQELADHVDHLSPDQTFQVVAYNQSVAYVTDRELMPANEANKRQLTKFVADLAAYGQTEHSLGLHAALRLKPEVIFLFTDGGDPPLDLGHLRIIREQAAGRTSIHCLHFGRGPRRDSYHFLARIAAENRGSYVYIDMNAR
jgi:von Willebrand factor type A domain